MMAIPWAKQLLGQVGLLRGRNREMGQWNGDYLAANHSIGNKIWQTGWNLQP
jgi:hypothetical protein